MKICVTHKIIKFLGENDCDLELSKEFLELTLKTWSIKERKTDKLGLIKIKSFAWQKILLR